jgi:hypothetical protein
LFEDENLIADWKFKNQLIASMPNLRVIRIDFDLCYYTCKPARIPTLQRLLETIPQCPVAKDVAVYVQNVEDEQEQEMLRAWRNSGSGGRRGSFLWTL